MNAIQFSVPIPAMRKPQASGQAQHFTPIQTQTDQLDIRFGALKKKLAPPELLEQARLQSAKTLGIDTAGQPLKLDILRQAFFDRFYTALAESLIENNGEELPFGPNLYRNIPDMNLGEDDLCLNENLLHYAFGDDYEIQDDNYQTVLGYASPKEYSKDAGRFRQTTARKLGLEIENPTDRQIIDKMGTMTLEELRSAFKRAGKAPKPAPKPGVVKTAIKKAIHTVAKEAPPAQASTPGLKRPPKCLIGKMAKGSKIRAGSEAPHPFSGKTFVLTGTLSSMTRDEAKKKIEAVGGTVLSSISGKVNFIVVGENPGNKLNNAKLKGVARLSESAFLENLGQ